MKKNRLLCKSKMQDFVRVFWEKQHVIKSYDKIKSFLLSRGDFPSQYIDLLAQPQINEHKKLIEWYSSAFETTPQQLSKLTEEKRLAYEQILEQALEAYRVLANDDQVSNEWKNLLQASISCVDYDSIYCADNKLVFSNWGTRKKEQVEHEMISLRLNPKKEKRTEQQGEEKSQETDSFPSNEEKEEIEYTNDEYSASLQSQEKEEAAVVDLEKEFVVEEKNATTNNLQEENSIENDTQTEDDKEATPIDKPKKQESRKKRSWLKYLLLLLLLLLLVFLFRGGCAACSKTNVLPPEMGVIPPVSSEDIGSSPDSLTKVVIDRLNILIKEKGRVEEFAEAFKTHYPKENYKIVYYDTLIQRVQIQLPKEQKEKMRLEIPRIMKDFDIYVWDESIFKSDSKPNDPAFNNRRESWYFELCKVFDAWESSKGSDSIIVAIIDDGFDLRHKEFENKIVKPYNIVSRDAHIFNLMLGGGHGTHVAGTAIASSDNYFGASGIAPACKLMPIQVANEAGIITTTAVMDAVLYAIFNGADVINLSLGMSFDIFLQFMPTGYQQNIIDNNFKAEEEVWTQIFDVARAQNTIIVIAAGNANVLTGIDPMQRHPYGIKVSAVASDKTKASFSNYGSYSTLSAPGVEIFNAVPGNRFEFMSGTSMASPIVAGAVALMKSIDKNLNSSQIVEILRTTGINTSDNIGPIIQLGRALDWIRNPDRKGSNPSDENNSGNTPDKGKPDDHGRYDNGNEQTPAPGGDSSQGEKPVPPALKPSPPGTKPTPPGVMPSLPGNKPLPPPTAKPTPPGTNPTAPGTKPTPPGAKPTPPRVKPIPPGSGQSPIADDLSCEEIQAKIDSLQLLIDMLRQRCPEMASPDTLKLPDNNSLAEIRGRWRSTTTLWNDKDEEVTLFFDFDGSSQGVIHFVEPDNTTYSSPTKLVLSNDELHIEQIEQASSLSNTKRYNKYTFLCTQYNRSRTADCKGKQSLNPTQQVFFNMVRVY